ncbi:hypothetical protein D3C76_129150 [compost metagenome]
MQTVEVALQIAIGHVERIVGENRPQQAFEVTGERVAAGLRGTLVAAHGGPGGVDEHAAIADLVMAEQAAEQRVVPGLGQLVVEPGVDQADVGVLDQWPLFSIQQHILGKALVQPAVDLGDLFFIQVDARRCGLLDLLPMRLLEALAGAEGDAPEMFTVVVEAIEDHPGDLGRGPGLGHAENLAAG